MVDSDSLVFLNRPKFLRERPIMLITDCPLDLEIKNKAAYSSQSAANMFVELSKVGIGRTQVHATYVFNFRPEKGDLGALFHRTGLPVSEYTMWPQSKKESVLNYAYNELKVLRDEIKEVNPGLIICAGRWALYFLTGETSVAETKKSPFGTLLKWRASHLKLGDWWEHSSDCVVMPVLPASSAWQLPEKSTVIKQDYVRVGILGRSAIAGTIREYTERPYEFVVAPKFAEVKSWLLAELVRLEASPVPIPYAIDVETRDGYHDCIGIAKSELEAICIPWATTQTAHYWTEAEEFEIYCMLREFLTHPKVLHIGQNYWYDMQYEWRDLLVISKPYQDTMVMQHTMFPGLEKSLDFLASLYAKVYKYWKEEGKTHKGKSDLERWVYNCKDCCLTFEVAGVLQSMLDSCPRNVQEAYDFQLNRTLPALVELMKRGVATRAAEKNKLYKELTGLMAEIQSELNYIIGEEFNPKSADQKKALFYDLFGLPVQFDPKTKKPTLNADALEVLKEKAPIITPIADRIAEYGNLATFSSTFLSAKLDIDGRMRCSYNLCGTDTFRLASSKNAFDSGMNLQNVPKGGETATGRQLPNVRSLFIPDPGYTFFDIDLASADARIVAWEAQCEELMAILLAGEDIYTVVAREYFHEPNLQKDDPRRQTFKGVVHGCLTGEHEVLTKSGWKRIDEFDETYEELAVWNKETWSIKFERPAGMNRDYVDSSEDLMELTGAAFHQITTLDHTFPYTVDKSENLKSCRADSLPKSARIPYVGYFSGDLEEPLTKMCLIAALQADGHISYTDKAGVSTFVWHFKKDRKADRLVYLLNSLGYEYDLKGAQETSDSSVRITIKGYLQDYMKYPGAWMLDYSQECLKTFVEELLKWDGNIRKDEARSEILTTNVESAEWYQTLAHLTGYGSKVTVKKNRGDNRKDLYVISLNNRKFHNMSSGTKRRKVHAGTMVYCPKTSTGFFMVRKNGNVMVTGNTNYLGSAAGLAVRFGLLVHEVDIIQKYYFGRFPEVRLALDDLKKQVMKRGWIENIFGYRRYFFNKQEPTLMQIAAAWKPQSTVGLIINRGMVNIHEKEPDIQTLLQVHDSLAGQFPTAMPHLKGRIIEHCQIELPYPKPLTIPVEIKTSEISWGECG